MSKIQTYRKGGQLRSLLTEMLYTKKENIQRTKNLLKEVNKIINKENIIIQLRTELKYIKLLNSYYKQYLTVIQNLKEKFLDNKIGVEKYCDELRRNGKNDTLIIDRYEEKINLLKKEKQEIIKTNEAIINIKYDVTLKLKTKLAEIETKINMNIEEINKQIITIKSLEDRKEIEKQEFLKEEEKQKKKIKKLKFKLNDLKETKKILESKIKHFEVEKGFKPIDLDNDLMGISILEKENKDIKLKEEEIKNQNLMEEVKDLTMKISHFSFDEHSKINSISTEQKSPIISSLSKKKKMFSMK